MKLRVRSLESKETHKIEIPNSYNLQQLKEVIILQLFPSSSSSSSSTSESLPHTLLLSLNRKEELCGSCPEESLQSLGVTSGDLIYYSRNPYAFSSENPNLSHVCDNGITSTSNDKIVDLMNGHKLECGKLNDSNAGIRNLINTQMEGSSKLGNPGDDTRILGNTQMLESGKVDEYIGMGDGTGELINTQVEGSSKLSDLNEGRSVDEMEVDDESEAKNYYKFSVPSFLKKVYVKVGDAAANSVDHRLLVIAVHAVLLESGFVGYDLVSGMKVDGFHLAEEWPSLAFGMTLYYTLPEVSTSEVVETVVLKFQTLGKYVNIYGSLTKKGSGVHRVSLDETRFLPALSYIWKRSDQNDFQNEIDGSRKLYPNQEIFEFWKIVKDELSYPLLIDLCERVGLISPPCFMRLPTELKVKILESLPAIDVARVECVSSELRFVASNNDLWKLKYEEEFGNAAASQRECQWKAKFCSALEIQKKRKRVCKPFQWREPPHFRPAVLVRRDPNPFVVRGDYDRLPAFGLPQHPGRRIFRSNCDLGGFGL